MFPIGIMGNIIPIVPHQSAEDSRFVQIIQPTDSSNGFEFNQLARSDVGSKFNQLTGQNVYSASASYAQPPKLDIENQSDMMRAGITLNQFNMRFTHDIKNRLGN